jgi:sulfate permease, SulP family
VNFRPKLLDTFKNYDRATFAADLTAGITVGVIALPLAIGFGIASGVRPGQGLWTAIIAGFLISAFGGSKVQIGGPTGAFVPILAGIVAAYGYNGLAVATLMAGIMLVLMGALRLGNLIKFIPYPVTAGFTSGIAVIIFIGQVKEFLGLDVKMPQHTPHQIATLVENIPHANWQSVALGLLALAILIFWPKISRKVPPSIVAIVVPTVIVYLAKLDLHGTGAGLFHLDVQTIGSRFGGIPREFPTPSLPPLSFGRIQELMIPALTIAMLGAIESLLSAIVADGMTESRHDSNQELMGQGIANIVTPFFGGISATGAIARTAANIRSGARSPVSGIVHALSLLVITLVAAPLARYIPLTALSAVLFVVAYRMGEWDNFAELWRGPKSDFGVLLTSFALTILFDLTVAVGVGLIMAAAFFVRRMEEITQIKLVTPQSDAEFGGESIREKDVPEGVLVYRIEGPFFFGAAEKLESAIARYAAAPRIVIFRMRNVPAMDATGLRALEITLDKFRRMGAQLLLSGVQPQPMEVLFKSGFVEKVGLDNICGNIDAALARARQILGVGQVD